MAIADWTLADGALLIVRQRKTPRPAGASRVLENEEWVAVALLQSGELLLEAYRRTEDLPAAQPTGEQFMPLTDVAGVLGTTVGEVVTQMVDDGLLLDVNGRLIASPHPSIRQIREEFT